MKSKMCFDVDFFAFTLLQVEAYHSGRAESETDFKDLNDKLSSALPSFDNKDDLVKKHEKMAQEAISGNRYLFIVPYLT